MSPLLTKEPLKNYQIQKTVMLNLFQHLQRKHTFPKKDPEINSGRQLQRSR